MDRKVQVTGRISAIGRTGTPHRRKGADRPFARLRSFRRQEAGGLTIFALTFMLLMIMMGGIAVDVMRYETRRTSLQNTLDRSTLAAASLTQDRDAKMVVEDYFRKSGDLNYLRSVKVTQGMNFKNVAAVADAETNPLFLRLMGVDSMDAFGKSTAEQRINNVEIMLVLDVSGSMASNNKLVNLKNAANKFVQTVMTNDVEHKISIGIVPFNGQVNLGPTLEPYFTTTDSNSLDGVNIQAGVNCVDLPPSVYDTFAIPTTTPLSMTANVDTFSGSSATTPAETNKWCPAGTSSGYYTGNPLGSGGNIVRMPQQDVATLQGYINGLQAVGATSINAGMKWGMTLLHPSVQPIYQTYIDAGLMPATMDQRPLNFTAKDAMKVIVLMTDGEHFAEERVNTSGTIAGTTYNFKTGASPIWQATDGRWSVFHANKVTTTSPTSICNSRPYWVPHLSAWHSRPWNGTAPLSTDCYVQNPTTPYAKTTNKTWPQVWQALRLQYVAQTFFATPLGLNFNTVLTTMRTQTATTAMDTQLQTACTMAKQGGVIVYGIAFEAPTNGQTQIRNCASSAAHYFDAQGIQITTAFAAIANNISQLRLTQ